VEAVVVGAVLAVGDAVEDGAHTSRARLARDVVQRLLR